jgi:hypothetical protein
MIVRLYQGRLLLVRQTDHQVVSGRLAEAWGNVPFARPEPFAPLVLAAAEHDNGWAEWEAAPRVNPATRQPYQFTEMAVEEHLTLYRRGVERVLARDPHAGLLVNLHLQGFFNHRFGTAPDIPDRRLTPGQQEFVQRHLTELQEQQRQVAEHIGLAEATLWAQYKLLQIYDRLSLYLCMPPLREATLGPVPVDGLGEEVTLALRPVGEGGVAVSPWPFHGERLGVEVEGRVVPDRAYEGDEAFRAACEAAEAVTLPYELRAGAGV